MSELSAPMCQKNWGEVDEKEKMERMRDAIKDLQSQNGKLAKLAISLAKHVHVDGKVCVDLNDVDYPDNYAWFQKRKDDIYF